MITQKELYPLVKAVKDDIEYDFLAFQEDEEPGIQLTIGYDPKDDTWSYQTGDNSFSGSAYHYPIWGVVGVYKNSNCREIAKDIIGQIAEQMWYYNDNMGEEI